MQPRRKYAPKRRLVRRKRLARPMRRRVYRGPRQGFLSIVRKLSQIQTYATGGTAGGIGKVDPTGTCLNLGTPVYINGTDNCWDVPFSMVFRLDQLMNATDITSISDQFKILSAFVKVHANYNLTGAGLANAVPFIDYIQDHDDAIVPSLALMREKMGVKTKYFSTSKPYILMGVRPRCADTVFQNGTSATGYSIPKSLWINTTYSGTEHYGIKGVIRNIYLPAGSSVGSLLNWDVSLKVLAKDFQ